MRVDKPGRRPKDGVNAGAGSGRAGQRVVAAVVVSHHDGLVDDVEILPGRPNEQQAQAVIEKERLLGCAIAEAALITTKTTAGQAAALPALGHVGLANVHAARGEKFTNQNLNLKRGSGTGHPGQATLGKCRRGTAADAATIVEIFHRQDD